MTIRKKLDVAELTEHELKLVEAAYGYIYQTNCSCGKLYIGLSKLTDRSKVFGYMGSGSKLQSHRQSHPDHRQSKIILEICHSYGDLELREFKLIRDAVERYGSKLVLNRKLHPQGSQCAECESFGPHLSDCSLVEADHICSECGGKRYHHLKSCSSYAQPTVVCEECGSRTLRHRKSCSSWTPKNPCAYCGSTAKFHLDGCALKVEKAICEECGTPNIGSHFKNCSQYKHRSGCSECGSKNIGTHLKECSKWKAPKGCEECGSQRRHRKSCSKFTESVGCSECGSSGNHRSDCSRSTTKACHECGSRSSNIHLEGCSQRRTCPECGSAARHLKSCSKSSASSLQNSVS